MCLRYAKLLHTEFRYTFYDFQINFFNFKTVEIMNTIKQILKLGNQSIFKAIVLLILHYFFTRAEDSFKTLNECDDEDFITFKPTDVSFKIC